MATALKGYRELATAFANADKDTKKGLPIVMREAAEPVRRDASTFAGQSIRRIGEKWAETRTGVTRMLVYVAPKQRGVKRKGDVARRRPNLAPLLMDRAFEPALHRHEADIERRVEYALDRLAAEFNRGGLL